MTNLDSLILARDRAQARRQLALKNLSDAQVEATESKNDLHFAQQELDRAKRQAEREAAAVQRTAQKALDQKQRELDRAAREVHRAALAAEARADRETKRTEREARRQEEKRAQKEVDEARRVREQADADKEAYQARLKTRRGMLERHASGQYPTGDEEKADIRESMESDEQIEKRLAVPRSAVWHIRGPNHPAYHKDDGEHWAREVERCAKLGIDPDTGEDYGVSYEPGFIR
jgi:hypothetical protein